MKKNKKNKRTKKIISRTQYIKNKVLNEKLTLEDKFATGCRNCNGCCKNGSDVTLSAYDLYRMAKEMGLSIKDFFEKYCDLIEGSNSSVPIILLQLSEETGKCALLKNGKCISNDARPTVCAMHPLGRFIDYTDDGAGKVGYILTDECKCKKPASYTVQEWLDLNGISTDDRIFLTWAEMTTNSLKIMNITKKDKQQSKTNLIFNILTHYLYFAYDTNEDFITQLMKNAKAIQDLLDSLKKPVEDIEK